MVVNLFRHGGAMQRRKMLTIEVTYCRRKRGENFDHAETALEEIRKWLFSQYVDSLPITEEERTP